MFNFFKKRGGEEPKPTFMDLLIRSGYFEFTDASLVESLKNKIQSSYEQGHVFNTVYNKEHLPICKKYYFCDSEVLFEEFGYKSQLKDMESGLRMVCNYESLINQMPESSDAKSQFEAVEDFASRVNDFLTKSNSNYQCYPAYGGNEGSMYILNDYQYRLLNKAIADNQTLPLELTDWVTKFSPKTSTSRGNSKEVMAQLKVGTKIKHLKFGVGQILGINDRAVASIQFESGTKMIMLKYLKIEIVD